MSWKFYLFTSYECTYTIDMYKKNMESEWINSFITFSENNSGEKNIYKNKSLNYDVSNISIDLFNLNDERNDRI